MTTTQQTAPEFRDAPIGVMDSGVGGFSILQALHQLLPYEDFVFVADQAHVPYGQRTLTEVQDFVNGIVQFFAEGNLDDPSQACRPVKLVVIACNTASAAALYEVREAFPQLKFIGLEPAVKPAAENTHAQKIGVIATAATFQGKLYASLVDRYASDVQVFKRACPEFVELVERGEPYDETDQVLVCRSLKPLLEHGIDHLVLGCTHFPFLKPLIQQCAGDTVNVIDPSVPVARQTQRVLQKASALTARRTPGHTIYLTTGDLDRFRQQVKTMMHLSDPDVEHLRWEQTSDKPLTLAY